MKIEAVCRLLAKPTFLSALDAALIRNAKGTWKVEELQKLERKPIYQQMEQMLDVFLASHDYMVLKKTFPKETAEFFRLRQSDQVARLSAVSEGFTF